MTINEFAKEIALKEGKVVQVNIAQIKEVLRVSNERMDGKLYPLIRKIEK